MALTSGIDWYANTRSQSSRDPLIGRLGNENHLPFHGATFASFADLNVI